MSASHPFLASLHPLLFMPLLLEPTYPTLANMLFKLSKCVPTL